MVGRTVSLPCSAIQHPHRDTPNLLLFYKTSSNIPFFSYDARSGDFWRDGSPKISDPKYEGRLSLNLSQPRKAFLSMKKVDLIDEGQITCRVDFLGSPSLTSIVDLRVYANPKLGPKITILEGPSDNKVITRSDVGPFYEGETLNLSCSVVGGHPIPKVTWWQDTVLLDNSSTVITGNPHQVTNDIQIGPLNRDLVRVPFTCRSENNPLTTPMDRTIHIKIHMAPESVLLPQSPTVSAWVEEVLECRAIGAYPEANVSWALDGRPLNFTALETRQVGTDTVSRVRFVARPENNGASISCTAVSPTLPVPPVKAESTLNVTHAPIVQLSLGSNLKPNEIRQGADVYFDCETVANPSLIKIGWYKNSEDVLHNKDKGVLVGGTNLVLQTVQRSDAGNYSCSASNSVGTTKSQTLQLSVQYAPMCAQTRQVLTVVEGDVLTLECKVDAYPSNVTFFWLFNNTVDSTRFRKSEYTSEGAMSMLRYVAYTARDYGTIYCWAQNVVSIQSNPCSFTLQPAGAPDSVRDCVLTNQSAGSLHITCKPGSDGGLTQSFRAEIFSSGSSEDPVRVLEGMMPVFTVEGLAPGGDYVVRVTALNKKGSSVPVSLEAFTLKVAENRMISGVSTSSNPEDISEPPDDKEISPLFGVIAGVIVVMFFLSIVAIFATRGKCSRRKRGPDIVSGQELDPRVALSTLSETSTKHSKVSMDESLNKGLLDHVETDPFLSNAVEPDVSVEGIPGPDRSLGGSSASVVFTIPANIPPPPQYCSGPCTEMPSSQHPMQHCSSPPPCGGNPHSYSNDHYQYQKGPMIGGHPHPVHSPSLTCTSPTSGSYNVHQNQSSLTSQVRSHHPHYGTNSPHQQGGYRDNSGMMESGHEMMDRMPPHSPVCYVTPYTGVATQYPSDSQFEQNMGPSGDQSMCASMEHSICSSQHSAGGASPSSGASIGTQETILGHPSPKGKQMMWPHDHSEHSFGYVTDEEPKEDCAL